MNIIREVVAMAGPPSTGAEAWKGWDFGSQKHGV